MLFLEIDRILVINVVWVVIIFFDFIDFLLKKFVELYY